MIRDCYAPDLNCRPTLIKDLGTIVKTDPYPPLPLVPFCQIPLQASFQIPHSRWRTDMWLEIQDCKLVYFFVIGT